MTQKELFDELRLLPLARRTIVLCGLPYCGKTILRRKIGAFYESMVSEGAPWRIIDACSVTKKARVRLAFSIPRTDDDILILVNPPLDTIIDRSCLDPLTVRQRVKIYKAFQKTKPNGIEVKSLGFKHFFIVDK